MKIPLYFSRRKLTSAVCGALLTGGGFLALPAKAQYQPSNLQIFSNHSYSLYPEMDKLLALTPEQQNRIENALREMVDNPEVAAAREAFKNDESLKDNFYKLQNQAKAKYRQVVEETLTAEQKELIQKISDIAKTAWDDFANIDHWGERSRKLREIGPDRLRQHLSPELLSRLGISEKEPIAAEPSAGAVEQIPEASSPQNP